MRREGTILTNEEFIVPPYGMNMFGEPIVRGGVELVYYLSCNKGVSCSSSHRWGRLYLPRLLLREGSFTQMYMAPLFVLVAPILPYQLWWNIPDPLDVLWSDCVDWWVMVPWGVPRICHQKSCQIPLYIVQDSPCVSICNGRQLHFFS